MGFAVVAEEVRNLAQRSAQAAKDTAGMIENNIELSEKGVNVTELIRDTLGEIGVEAKKMNGLMAEIAASSQEQTQGILQINKAIAQMETVVQQNASSAEESASASEELSAQAQNLKGMVQQLLILVHGKIEEKFENLTKESRREQENNDYQSVAANQQILRQTSQGQLSDTKTRLVSPEEVIPLEDDNNLF
jgi:hypothetical protein